MAFSITLCRRLAICFVPLAVLAVPVFSHAGERVTSTDASETLKSKTVAANVLPPTIVVYGEIADPPAIMATVLDHPLRARLEQLPVYDQLLQTDDIQKMQMGVAFLEGLFGMPWRTTIEQASHNGIAIAFDEATMGIALIVRSRDGESAETIFEKAMQLAMVGQGGKMQEVEYRGVKAYRRNDLRVARHDDSILVTNNGDLGKVILDNMIDRSGKSLVDVPEFQAALSHKSEQANGWGFLSFDALRKQIDVSKFLTSFEDNPPAEILFGGIQSSLAKTPYGTASLEIDQSKIALNAAIPFDTDWIPEHRQYYFGPDAKGIGPELPVVENELLTIRTYRDFAQLWMRSGDLFNERINDEFAKADATLTTIFAGRDFGEDILGAIEPEVAIVSARQDFSDQLPRPTIKIPAFALMMKMKDPEVVSRDFRRTFQTLVGFFNVVGAQNGLNQLELDMEKFDDGAQLVISRYVPEPDDAESTEAEIVFNFSPTLGFSGDRLVLASTTGFARELTLAPIREDDAQDQADNVELQVHANVLRQTLADNRAQLVAQNMLEEGHSHEEAEAVIDLVLEAVGFFQGAELSLANESESLKISLQINVESK
ncbi:DUF3352 domain-containing protein [Stieleria sp. JC731]|uniref:DUF3352 domain-containing protein n=1 Tax=Pirellulaceae TaxID=2691357 RepID=UPI001E4BF060|nr:DUF3352 domain-containing protein [Stieleria sp. JC731]MCC9603813.1 DUF3352 domain-containing protein [Stieleria sp. JC731]